ncbi:MAG TPA: helix-turn-helix domain-containing protein [Candidatus Limnocylindrales bacterium]|nr:helix-turn-helix domain-containing protein [Candidatus Limnocylindrales bacterium]
MGVELNSVGDVVLRDARTMRALAEPGRLTVHDALRRGGPMTLAALATAVGMSVAEVRAHVESLAAVGLVELAAEPGRGTDTCAAVGIGVFFEIPDDPEGQSAARALAAQMLLQNADLPRRWATDVEPKLPIEWARAAGMIGAKPIVTPAELAELQAAIERLLEPYLTRVSDAVPAAARPVRVLGFFMPDALSEGNEPDKRNPRELRRRIMRSG